MKHQDIKENLIKQYNETLVNLQRLEGAIAVLNQLDEVKEASSEDNTEDSE